MVRALLRGERRASPLVVLAFIAAAGIAGYFLVQAASWRNQFYDLKHTIYTRCVQRDAYDRASQTARAAQADYYQRLIANLHTNARHDLFNRQLELSARRAVRDLRRAVSVGAPRGCDAYR